MRLCRKSVHSQDTARTTVVTRPLPSDLPSNSGAIRRLGVPIAAHHSPRYPLARSRTILATVSR